MDQNVSSTEFSIAYDGERLRDSTMDVRELAPALLAIGQLFDEANRLLNGKESKVDVIVRATKAGSFEINFDLVQIASDVVHLFEEHEIIDAKLLLALIMGGSAAIACPLLQLIRKLRGRRPERIEASRDGSTVSIAFGDTELEVPAAVLRMYNDRGVRKSMEKVVEPLKGEGIEMFRAQVNGQTVAEVESGEAHFFDAPDDDVEPEIDQEIEMILSIVAPVLERGGKWRVHNGGKVFHVSIDDQAFIDEVEKGVRSFAAGDKLRCIVRMRQWSIETSVKIEYSIQKVIKHDKTPRQMAMFRDAV